MLRQPTFAQELFKAIHQRRSGVLAELEDEMEQRTSMRKHADAPSLCNESGSFQLAPCHEAGFCLCGDGDAGSAVHFRSNLVALFRPFLRAVLEKQSGRHAGPVSQQKRKAKKPVPRQLMEQGMFVFKFTSEEAESSLVRPDLSQNWEQICDELARDVQLAVLPRGACFAATPPPVCKTVWAHVSFANYRDWKFTFLLLEELPESERQQSLTMQHRSDLIALKVSDAGFHRDLSVFAKLGLDCSWKAAAHAIFVDDEGLCDMDMTPDIVEVSRLKSIPELQIWKARVYETWAEDETASWTCGEG